MVATSDVTADCVSLADVRTLWEEIKAHRGGEQGKLPSSAAIAGESQDSEHTFGVHAFEVSLLNCYGLDIMYQVSNIYISLLSLSILSDTKVIICSPHCYASTWNCPFCV
jgi:hypothetical protein